MPYEYLRLTLGPRVGNREVDAIRYHGDWEFVGEVVGESHYRSTIVELFGVDAGTPLDEYCEATLMPDDGNAHDENAVCVLIKSQIVGYLPRDTARDYRKIMLKIGVESQISVVDARVSGNRPPKGLIGVEYDMCLDTLRDEA